MESEVEVEMRKGGDSLPLFAFRERHEAFPVAPRSITGSVIDSKGRLVHEDLVEPVDMHPGTGLFRIPRSALSGLEPGTCRMEFFHNDSVGTRTAIQTPNRRFHIVGRVWD